MRACFPLPLLVALTGLCSQAAAKPEPDAATLKFIVTCVRDYAWWPGFDTPGAAREERYNRDYLQSRHEAHASRLYLSRLSAKAFRRHYDDALYLTTARSKPRYCIAYAAARRGVDVLENCARMNDALHRVRRPPKAWEDSIIESVAHGGFMWVDVDYIPKYLADFYRRNPDDRILRLLFNPAGPSGCECGNDVIAQLAATHTHNLVRFAVRDSRNPHVLASKLSGDIPTDVREKARRNLRRIVRAGGSLAPTARVCLQDMARWDAMIAKEERAARERAARGAPGVLVPGLP